jgi:hypothetical protein
VIALTCELKAAGDHKGPKLPPRRVRGYGAQARLQILAGETGWEVAGISGLANSIAESLFRESLHVIRLRHRQIFLSTDFLQLAYRPDRIEIIKSAVRLLEEFKNSR